MNSFLHLQQRTTARAQWMLLVIALLSLSLTAQAQTIRYVKPTSSGNGNGSSWANASSDLQAMINTSGVTQVWVAQGTYKPTTGTDRTISFRMKNGVAIYGGFVGNETALNQRPAVNPAAEQPSSSILSGEIGDTAIREDNSLHVIDNPPGLTQSAILDGFVITKGYSYSTPQSGTTGGGVINRGNGSGQVCSPTFENCLFLENTAIAGGGMHNDGSNGGNSSPVLRNCAFRNNSGSGGYGGGILNNVFNGGVSNVQISNSLFVNNYALFGGGIANGDGGVTSLSLTNCSFIGNQSNNGGGALYSYRTGHTYTITNCSFQANVGRSGGDVLQSNDNVVTITNSVLFNRSSLLVQGGVLSINYTLADRPLQGTGNLVTTVSPFVSTSSTQLNSCAPAINAGDNNAYTTAGGPATDLAANTRVFGGAIDMGAYEYQAAPNPGLTLINPTITTATVGTPFSDKFSASGGVSPYSFATVSSNLPTSLTLSNAGVLSGTPTESGSFTLTVRASDANGCSGVSATYTLVVTNATPTLAGFAASPNVVCAGSPVTFTATVGNITGSYNYTLTNGGNSLSGIANTTAFSQSLTAAGSGSQSFTLLVSANGQSAQATTNVTVNSLPDLALSAANGCAGQALSLSATGADSYTFTGSSGVLAGSGNTRTVEGLAAGTYSFSVVGSTASGCVDTDVVSVTVSALPLATLVSSGTLSCAQTSVTLTATGGNTGETFSYAFARLGGGGIISQNPAGGTAVVNASGTYSVTVTNAAGCVSVTTTSVSSNTTVPMADILTPTSRTLSCTTPTLTLTATGGGTYRWDDNSTSATRVVSTSGTYSVTVTAASGCTALATTTIQSNTSVISAGLVASGSITCATTSVTLTASGGTDYTFRGLGLSQNGPANTAIVTQGGTYSVVVTGAGGCSALATVTVTGSTTAPAASLVASGSINCNSPSVTLTAEAGGASYAFRGPALDQTGSANTAIVTQAGTYSVVITGANGCTASAQVTVTGSTSAPTVSLASNGTITCANTSVTLTATPSGQGTYAFSGGAQQQGGSTGNTAIVSAGGTYSVVVTGANGCTVLATTTVESATNAVNATLIASGTITCANTSVTLTASPLGASTYQFSGPGLSQNGPANTAIVTQTGTYSVIVTNASGCSALATTTVQSSTALPQLSISALPSTSVNQGQSVTLTASGAASGETLSFTWSSGQQTASINPPTSTTGTTVYSVSGTTGNGCGGSAQVTLTVSATTAPPPTGVCGSQPGTLGQPLTILEPLYNCQTGMIQFRTAGGDGSPITYAAIGITGPTQSCSATVDAEAAFDIRNQRPNIQPFTLFATQGGITVTYSWNALTACAGQGGNGSPRLQNPVPPQSATVGVAYSLDLSSTFTDTETPGQLSLSVRGLPQGLQLVGSTILGTPTQAGVSSVTLTATDPGNLASSTSFAFVVSPAQSNTGVGGPLAATVVSYDCPTGAILFGATGGNGSAVEYFAIGITGWTSNPNQTIEAGLRADPRPITLRVRQGGMEGQPFVFDFGAFCQNGPQPPTNTPPVVASPVGTQSAMVGVGYSLNVGGVFTDAQTPAQLALSVSGLPADLQLVGNTITGVPSVSGVSQVTLTATDPGSLTANTTFTLTVSPAAGTPPVSGPLSATVVSYNCGTGAIVFGATGGTGAPVEYFAIGVTGWTSNSSQTIEAGLRADPKPVTVRVRQGGMEGQPFVFDFGAFCQQGARQAREALPELVVRVLGNPTTADGVTVEVEGLADEVVSLDVVNQLGQPVSSQVLKTAAGVVRTRVGLGAAGGTYLLRVSTSTQAKTVLVVRQ